MTAAASNNFHLDFSLFLLRGDFTLLSRFAPGAGLVILRHEVCTHGLRDNHRSGTAKFLAASGSMKALSASSVDGSIITLLHRPSPWSMTIAFCVPGSIA